MVGSSKGSHRVGLVADYLPACLEEELYLVQLQAVSTSCRNAVIAAYLFRVELPSRAERCPRGSPQRLGNGHSQEHLKAMSAIRGLSEQDHLWSSGHGAYKDARKGHYTLIVVH